MWFDFDREYNLALKKLRESKIDGFEKESIEKLCNKLLAEGISKARVTKYLKILRLMLERGCPTYADIREEDLYKLMAWIQHDWNLSKQVQYDYLHILKRMLKYHGLNEFDGLIRIKTDKSKKNIL